MIEDFEGAAQLPERADVIVVGAGAVGIPLAVRLARGGKRVLLLEAGGSVRTEGQEIEGTISIGRHLKGLQDARLRALGGTTNAWGGQLLEFDPAVLDGRDWIENSAWPFSRSELDPFYDAAFEMLGMRNRIKVDATVWKRLGVLPPATGSELDLFFTRWLPEPNFARAFKNDLTKNPNLRVLTSAVVTGLRDRGNEGAVGVTITGRNGTVFAVSAGAVILAHGTIEIARLLSMPLADGMTAPWAGSPWLGRGFFDHVDADVGRVKPIDPKRFHRVFDGVLLDGLKYLPKLRLSNETQKRKRLLGIAAHFVFESSREDELKAIKSIVRGLMRGCVDRDVVRSCRSLAAVPRVAFPAALHLLRHRRIYNPGDQGIILRVTGEQAPLRESGLRLTNRKDAFGMPVAELDWRIDGHLELETMATFSTLVSDFLECHGLAKVELEPQLVARDSAFLSKIEDGYHQMGMARMGTSPMDGVVDENLRVFGTKNLYIAGAATFPPAGFPNPTLTAIALALRLGEALLHRPVATSVAS